LKNFEKILWFVFAVLTFTGTIHAQTTLKQGFAINPNFVGPAQFVETNSGWKLLPNAGLSVSAEWQKTMTNVVSGVSNTTTCWSAGLCFEENFGETSNQQTVNNAVLGITGDYKGYSAVIGLQVLGPSLGGQGSNGLVVGVSYQL
jgi:hypothetical protein